MIYLFNRNVFQLRSDEFLNLDSIFEEVLHFLIVKPLKDHLANLFRKDFQRSGCLQLISSQMEKVRKESSKSCFFAEMISADFPDLSFPNVMSHCQESFRQLESAFSPAEKLSNLLTALKQIVNLVRFKVLKSVKSNLLSL